MKSLHEIILVNLMAQEAYDKSAAGKSAPFTHPAMFCSDDYKVELSEQARQKAEEDRLNEPGRTQAERDRDRDEALYFARGGGL